MCVPSAFSVYLYIYIYIFFTCIWRFVCNKLFIIYYYIILPRVWSPSLIFPSFFLFSTPSGISVILILIHIIIIVLSYTVYSQQIYMIILLWWSLPQRCYNRFLSRGLQSIHYSLYMMSINQSINNIVCFHDKKTFFES